MQSVAVVGGSNGGYAAAADFADRGFAVSWYLDTPANHRAVLSSNTLTMAVSEHYTGPKRTAGATTTVEIEEVTSDIQRAVSGSDTIVVPLPTTAQGRVIDMLVPCLEAGQTVLFCPGNFGSYLLARELADRSNTPRDLTIAETPTLPYVCRKSGPGEVTINLDAVDLPVGAFPGTDRSDALATASELFEAARPATNALDAALNNSNVCVNATPTVLNAGAIECDEFDQFNIHRHGVSERVYSTLMAVDAERVRIREALGFDGPHFTQDEYYRPDSSDGTHFYGEDARAALTAADTFSEDPPSLDDRYVHEDVGIAAVLQASVGRYLDVDTPTIDAIITLADRLLERDLRESGRSLRNLGLRTLSRAQFEDRLRNGFENR